jgi:hypothetical protein
VTYTEIRYELAQILCPHLPRPCDACLDAAYRVVVHRRSIRRALVRFAKQQAGLMPDPRSITSSDLKTMVMQEDDDAN